MSLKNRLRRLETVAVLFDPPPLAIEQGEPGGPVRFHLNEEHVEMSAEELRRRWADAIFMAWTDQPWTGKL